MPPLPFSTAIHMSPTSTDNSPLTTRSTSSEDPLLALYIILGVIGGVFTLLVLAFTFLLGGGYCCWQARKAYQTFAGNRRHTIIETYNHGPWHGHSNQSRNTPAAYRSHEGATGPRPSHYIQPARSESYKASPSTYRASTDDHQTPRFTITYPPASHTKYSQRPENWSYPWQTQAHPDHKRSPSPLSRSVSGSGYHTNQSRSWDVYIPQRPFESHRPSHSPSQFLPARPRSMSSQLGPNDYHYQSSRRPKLQYGSLSRRSSRERSERRASRPPQLRSLSSDGRPGLASDC